MSYRLESSLLLLFLAVDAVAGPRHSFEAFLGKFLVALLAFAVSSVLDAFEGGVDESKQAAIIVSLAEEKFLGVGIGGFVSEIDCGIFVGFASLLLGAGDRFDKLLAASLKFLFVVIETLLIHSKFQSAP